VPSDAPSTVPSASPSDVSSTAPALSFAPSIWPSGLPSDVPSHVPSDVPSDIPSSIVIDLSEEPSAAPVFLIPDKKIVPEGASKDDASKLWDTENFDAGRGELQRRLRVRGQ
jgi:hypothetical protein